MYNNNYLTMSCMQLFYYYMDVVSYIYMLHVYNYPDTITIIGVDYYCLYISFYCFAQVTSYIVP